MRPLLAFLLMAGSVLSSAGQSEHAGLIRGLDSRSLLRGQALYESLCITCHGAPTQEGTLPTSRPFWKEPFKNGGDPYSLFKTLTTGLGQMPPLSALSPQQRYDAIHYIRETFVRPLNPSAYFAVDEKYLASLPADAESLKFEEAPKEPAYLRMDFGPALFWTFQVASNNIAYKGIAIRLDPGPGGVSKGRAWMLYDHDTMRVAAAWTGTNFIDWRGIAFDGSHQTHARIVGDKAVINPVGPGWADPATGSFEDPRFRGRDNKPYGPLPRDWAQFTGAYFHSNRVVLSYAIGDAQVFESPAFEQGAFSRTFNISKSSRDLEVRLTPDRAHKIKASETPINLKINLSGEVSRGEDLTALTRGGPPRWEPALVTAGKLGSSDAPFAVDELVPPPDAANPWHTWMRFGGFDFFEDARRAAICTWNGDVWIVSGIDESLARLTWKRIASGLFQPLGVKIVNETIYVTCRDQIARLHDFNRDDEIDFVECFNNDHQVTEHFHEFAMGLQTDDAGNFYYAKSARHALPAIVPHHGTLLKVSKDGARTEIVATGFRAANGVCVNEDGTFFVTDQEGHWTPKNRINHVRPGAFYGNMFGYHHRTSARDEDMEQPVVWITNEMDRSPGELVRIASDKWGSLNGALLNLSYGTGRIFIVPHETIDGQMQGGVAQLPIDELPTGVMRGRFHPDGGLYACGMFAWAGNRQHDGGFYRIRKTAQPACLPIELHARPNAIEIVLSDPVEPGFAARPENYAIKTWSLRRSANYGSKHFNEQDVKIASVTLYPDSKRILLQIPNLSPTQSMEIRARLRAPAGDEFTRVIHNTIHRIAP